MGADKALVPWRGRPLVEHALGILRGAGLEASIAGSRSPLSAFGPVIEDVQADRGPLGGICAALASTSAQLSVFVPVDLPLLPSSLMTYLMRHAAITGRAVTLASVAGFTQTFPAVLDRAVLPWLRGELAKGRLGCFQAFEGAAASLGQPGSAVAVELLVQSGAICHPDGLPPSRWFTNLNTPVDLRDASK
jgi:molybdopterin-guanine dinucleotide biosynthesis protein A